VKLNYLLDIIQFSCSHVNMPSDNIITCTAIDHKSSVIESLHRLASEVMA